jgi:hypothetical protein
LPKTEGGFPWNSQPLYLYTGTVLLGVVENNVSLAKKEINMFLPIGGKKYCPFGLGI